MDVAGLERAIENSKSGDVADDDLIVIEGLRKHYGPMAALDDVSLTVRRGEFLSLLGPSGCGKTTLLRAIAGFVELDAGEICIEGKAMNHVPPNRRPVNMVFQNYALFPHMTVADNVAFGPRRRKRPKGEVAELVRDVLGMVGMEDFGDRYPRSLSGGQQQRVALARALVNRPQVLLLDEPLAALDLKLRKRMQIELKRLHDRLRITFIYVTHDQEEALTMSDRIAVMKDGTIVQFADGREIYRNPASRYVADFIGEANLIDCRADTHGRIMVGSAALSYEADSDGATTLMVRPEDIRIGTGGAEAVTVKVRLREKIFLGRGWRLAAQLETGQEIMIQPGTDATVERLVVGEETPVWWPRDRGRVLAQ